MSEVRDAYELIKTIVVAAFWLTLWMAIANVVDAAVAVRRAADAYVTEVSDG